MTNEPWDEARLQEMQEDDRRRAASHRTRNRILLIAGVLGGIALVGLFVGSAWTESNKGQNIQLIGRQDAAVRVEIEGEEPIVLEARQQTRLKPSRPGDLRFRFTAPETDESFEMVLHVPPNDVTDYVVLAVPTAENMCFAALDVSAWYGGSQSLLQIAADRANSDDRDDRDPKGAVDLPRPKVLARLRPLDPLPTLHYSRNWNLPSLVGDNDEVVTLVDVPCAELAKDDNALIDWFLSRSAQG